MADKYDYTVKRAGFFYGAYRKVGDLVRLTDTQAQYEVMAGNLHAKGKEPGATQNGTDPATLVADAAAAAAGGIMPIMRPRKSRNITERS